MTRQPEYTQALRLRRMEADDVALFERWLAEPHVAKWFRDPQDWLAEVLGQNDEFSWISHYIAEHEGAPVGFGQLYACADSDEGWGGCAAARGSYSIDYMIGEPLLLGKGLGKALVNALVREVAKQRGAKRVVVQPERENAVSRGLLRACGFEYDAENELFVRAL